PNVDAEINGATHLGGQRCGDHEDRGDSTNYRKLAEHEIGPQQGLNIKRPTRPTGLGMLEISEAGSAWPSTAAPDRGLGRRVAGRGRASIRGLQGLTPSLIWLKAVGIEDGNCEKVTTRMQPTVIVWDLKTVPDLRGFAPGNDLVGAFGGKADLR